MTVKVSKKNIDGGARANCQLCPVALALLEQFPDSDPIVESAHVSIKDAGNILIYRMPDEAVKFVDDFDEGLEVKPFKFELGDPEVKTKI